MIKLNCLRPDNGRLFALGGRTAGLSTGLATLILGLGTRAPLRGFAEIERGELLLATTAAGTFDSDIQGGPNGREDYIYSLYPDLLFKRDAALVKLDTGVGVTFNRFQTYSQFDSNDADAHFDLGLSPDAGLPGSGTFQIGYAEKNDIDYDLSQRVRSKSLASQLDTLFPLSLKTSISVQGSFNRVDRGSFGTQQTEGGGAAFNYENFLYGTNLSLAYRRLGASASSVEGSPAIDQNSNSYLAILSHPILGDLKASATYGYRFLDRSASETLTGETRVDGPFYSVGLEGPFLPQSVFPKLKSSLSVSYEEAATPGINDLGGNRVVANASLSWDATDTTRFKVRVARLQELASINTTVVTSEALAEMSQDIGHFVHAAIGGGAERLEYQGIGRRDNVGTAFARADYNATKSFLVGIDYSLHSTSSTEALAGFSRDLVKLYATYTF